MGKLRRRLPAGLCVAGLLAGGTLSATGTAAAGTAVVDADAGSTVEQHTLFVLDSAKPLSQVTAGIAVTGLRPFALEHINGERRGGFSSRLLDLKDTVAQYRLAYQDTYDTTTEPRVFAFRLEGATATEALGDLAEDVLNRALVPAASTVYVAPPEKGGTVTADPGTSPASTPETPWAPESGKTIGSNVPDSEELYCEGVSCFALTRKVTQYVTFSRSTPGNEFDGDWAYEHDFKQKNYDNPDRLREFCGDSDRFWTNRDLGVHWDTNMPDAYLDTPASDSCQQEDLTVGSFHPTKFTQRTYTISLMVAPGEESSSPYALHGQVLERHCDDEWCVNTLPWDYDDADLLIGETRGVLPGCRTYINGDGSYAC